ncbi:MAG: hydrogenase nickel incorporation protein HypB [Phycisphaerae bacterium]
MNVQVVRKVLERNLAAAEQNRTAFARRGITCINLLGGPGCGKTTLLEGVLPRLTPHLRCAVLEGDPATTRDAERIAALRVPVVQLVTDGGCHLNADHVQRAIDELGSAPVDLLLIENVGNLVCPANFDLGEHARIAVLSVVEGDDKPAKYALAFRTSQLVVLSKFDLLPYVRFDTAQVRVDLLRLNPELAIVETDAPSQRGFDSVAAWIRSRVALCAPQTANPLCWKEG